MRIASGIHRIGDHSIINAYLIEEANEVTLVDAGVAGLYRDLPKELASMGRTIEDVRALILTHGHSDHVGFAERLRTERHIPVSVHEADAALARGEVPNPSKGFGPTKVGPLVGFLWFSLVRGGLAVDVGLDEDRQLDLIAPGCEERLPLHGIGQHDLAQPYPSVVVALLIRRLQRIDDDAIEIAPAR